MCCCIDLVQSTTDIEIWLKTILKHLDTNTNFILLTKQLLPSAPMNMPYVYATYVYSYIHVCTL